MKKILVGFRIHQIIESFNVFTFQSCLHRSTNINCLQRKVHVQPRDGNLMFVEFEAERRWSPSIHAGRDVNVIQFLKDNRFRLGSVQNGTAMYLSQVVSILPSDLTAAIDKVLLNEVSMQSPFCWHRTECLGCLVEQCFIESTGAVGLHTGIQRKRGFGDHTF